MVKGFRVNSRVEGKIKKLLNLVGIVLEVIKTDKTIKYRVRWDNGDVGVFGSRSIDILGTRALKNNWNVDMDTDDEEDLPVPRQPDRILIDSDEDDNHSHQSNENNGNHSEAESMYVDLAIIFVHRNF